MPYVMEVMAPATTLFKNLFNLHQLFRKRGYNVLVHMFPDILGSL